MATTEKKKQEFPKAYDHRPVEERLYRFWMEGGYFTPEIDHSQEPFVIIMPPPNVTGELHMGHALTATLQDIMARWHRMRGEPTLWLPGTDHAGIATQVVVERALQDQDDVSRHQLGREQFEERVWEWVRKYGGIIAEQHKRLGASCDWTRERFTLDPGPSRAVLTTFVNLYKKGLIYRGEHIINWCTRCMTTLSDLEVNHGDSEGELYHIRYKLQDSNYHLTVATTRPETLLGDTAVAVNPNDERYRDAIGKNVLLPVLGRPIPVIADEAVEIDFGTGALKITPGHDATDFEVGQRHDLPIVNVMNLDGTMNQEAGPYAGQDRFAVRRGILQQLEQEGLLERTEPYKVALGRCYRCRHHRRAYGEHAVVCRYKTAGQACNRGGGGRANPHCSGAFHQGLHELDGEHPRLDYQPPALVGASHTCVVLRRVRRKNGGGGRANPVRALRLF